MVRTRLMPSTESITHRSAFTEISFHPLKHIIYLFISMSPPILQPLFPLRPARIMEVALSSDYLSHDIRLDLRCQPTDRLSESRCRLHLLLLYCQLLFSHWNRWIDMGHIELLFSHIGMDSHLYIIYLEFITFLIHSLHFLRARS